MLQLQLSYHTVTFAYGSCMLKLSLFFFALSLVSIVYAGKQSVAVTGKLTCNGKPFGGAKIKIYDRDSFTTDDKLAETKTDNNGFFHLEGTGNEISNLNTHFNIYHRCNKKLPVCYYKNTFKIPSQYVSSGTRASRPFDAQTIELSLLKKERDCIN